MFRPLFAGLLIVLAAVGPASAQGRPRAALRPVAETDGARAGSPTRVALVVTLPETLHVQSNRPRDQNLIPTGLAIEAPAGVVVSDIVYPPAMDFAQVGQREPLSVFPHEFVVAAELTIGATVPLGDLRLGGRFRYQACDDKACFGPMTVPVEWTLRVVAPTAAVTAVSKDIFARAGGGERIAGAVAAAAVPAVPVASAARTTSSAGTAAESGLARVDRFTVLGSQGGYLGRTDFLTFIRNAENGVVERGMLDGRGPIAILAIILLGGLALNLTPCVLPMIPINLAIIGAGAQAGSRRRGFLLGSAYGGAMALVYGVLGLVVILTAGTFGTINASAWFNLGIAALFVVLGLAMFDVILIDFSRFSSNFRPTGRGTFALAFTMGAVAALLAGACVAPVVIQVVLFSSSLYAGGTTLALALPFVLGLGMALPWPIAGAGLAALPKPGMWMVRVKQAFGVLILLTAAYYAYLGYTILANRWVDPAAVSDSVNAQLKDGWVSSIDEGLAAAEREGKPVLIDFWATWCKNCLTMDQTTLANAEVKAALSGYVKIKFQAEDPDAEPARSVMARFKAIGLPTYVVLKPGTSTTSSAGALGAGGSATLSSPATIVADVRRELDRKDPVAAAKIVTTFRAAHGVTPEGLAAQSWLARGAVAASDLDAAERHAQETYDQAVAMLATKTLEAEPSLATALAASIEVRGQVLAARGARSEAVLLLTRERDRFAGSPIEKRTQKNLNLLTLEGAAAPTIDVSQHLGVAPQSLVDLKGRVVVFFFWAHWCADCKAQAPILEKLVATYGSDGLSLLAPTQLFGYVAEGRTAAPAEERPYIEGVRRQDYPVLRGQGIPVSAANHIRYGVSSTPTLAVVDRAGILRAYHPGRMTWDELVAVVEPLVRSAP